MIRIFVGWDHRQPVAFSTLIASIIAHTKEPVAITPLVIGTLPAKRVGLTPFTYSRFLVPFLCQYDGWGLFLDADIMVRGDLAELWQLRHQHQRNAVAVVKNQRRFEWASVMLFNCARCRVLTPDYVETADNLHGIGWADESAIGELGTEWNHLVGYDAPNPDAKIVHFTQGVPAFPETMGCEFSDEWHETMRFAGSVQDWQILMGNSVHAAPVMERLRQTEGASDEA